MNKTFITATAAALLTGVLGGCRSTKPAQAVATPAPAPKTTGGSSSTVPQPRLVLYKTTVDCTDLVPITLNPTRTQIVSYPAPSDLTDNSTPLAMADGWLLDRRGGIGTNTVFTKYTYAEYRALKQAPTPQQLMRSIVPGARVSATLICPWGYTLADTAAINNYIRINAKAQPRLTELPTNQ